MATLDELQADLELALSAVRDAGDAVMAYFRTGTEVHFKSADQPVTAADLAADALLRERLSGARPGYGWLSEESAASPDRLERTRVWVVDPIDGTNAFVAGTPEFVVSVGLVEDGEPIVAALFNPATGELYHAAAGRGAFRNGEPIRARAAAPGEKASLLVSWAERRRGDFTEVGEEWHVSTLGSTAYRMLRVADGTVHAFVSRSRKAEWDVCGATLVVLEAGGRVYQGDGAPVRFNQPVPTLAGIVVLGPEPVPVPPGWPAARPAT